MKNAVKTATINVFVDPERGFMDAGLTDKEGGVLYVPNGEEVIPVMGSMITGSRDTIFVLGQDYHPANHISFMVNHPGVMEYRMEKFKAFLAEHGQPELEGEDLYNAAQQPVHFFNGFDQPPAAFPFDEVVFDEDQNIIGLKEADGRIRKVKVETTSGLAPTEKDRGRVTKVLDEYHHKTFDAYRTDHRLLSTLTLWTKHCVQGTDSCLYPEELNLPQGLEEKLASDMMSTVIYHRDAASGNEFYVIRKGGHSEVDSYGIGVENDGETKTGADGAFREIARNLKRQGVKAVEVNGGGLATNFCTEFSLNNVDDFLAGYFKMAGMHVTVSFVPEISRGIPIPGGPEVPFSLEGVEGRLAQSRGIGTKTVADIMKTYTPVKTTRPSAQFPRKR